MATSTWTNWSESVVAHPQQIFVPKTEGELIRFLKRGQFKKIRVAGSGHSFTDLVDTDTVIILMDQLQGLISHDPETLQATVWGGTKLKALGETLHSLGMAQVNLGDIDVQSITGAFSTGTHGSGTSYKAVANQVIGIRLVTASGKVIECSETQNREIFKAAQVSLGSLGIITQVTLQAQKAYKLKYESKKSTIRDTLRNLERYKAENRSFEFYWFPFTDTVQLKFLNETDEPIRVGKFSEWFDETVMENGVFGFLSLICKHFPGFTKTVSKISAMGVPTGSKVNWSHKVFATVRKVKFLEMEYNIPAEHFSEVLLKIKETVDKHQFKVHFPIECRWSAGDEIPICPAYGRDSAYIAIHMFKGMPYKDYFDAIEEIFKLCEGRPHWGKMHTQTAEELQSRYPKWHDFHKLRKELDPDGVFMNDHLKEIFESN